MPSHWAAAGAASTITAPTIDTMHFICDLSRRSNLHNLHNLPNLPNLHNLSFSVHPHRRDRHTRERVIPQAARDARVEHPREPEVGAHTEAELECRGAAATGDEPDGGLHVGHDAHRRSLGIDAAAERQAHGNEQRRAAAHEARARAEHEGAVEREVDRVGDHALARLEAGEQHGFARAGRIEDASPQPDVERAARVAVRALEPRAASVGKAEHGSELRALKCPIGRVERGHARRLRPGDRRHSCHGRHHQQRHLTSHGSLASNEKSVRQGTQAAVHRSATPNATARPRACGRAVTTHARLMPEGQPKPDADRECARQHAGREGVREVAFGPEHGAPVGEPLPDPTTDRELGFGTRTGAELQDVQPTPAVTYGARISPRVPLPRFSMCSTFTPGLNATVPMFESQSTAARTSNMFGPLERNPTRASTGAASWMPDPPLLPRLTYWNARSTPSSFWGPASAAARRCAAPSAGYVASITRSSALPMHFRMWTPPVACDEGNNEGTSLRAMRGSVKPRRPDRPPHAPRPPSPGGNHRPL